MFSGERKSEAAGEPSIDTLVGENTTITGDVRFQGGLHVDGHIDGSVATVDGQDGQLTLSERGSIKGEVKVPIAVINGRVDGDIVAGKRLELNSQARVSGNIRYRSIQMQFGSEVNGQLMCDNETAAVTPVKRLAEPDKVPKEPAAGAAVARGSAKSAEG